MILEVSNLYKQFGGLRAVNDVSITVRERSIHAVIGPNGAGKTTLFNLITGALKPNLGTVKFQGRDVTGASPHALAKLGLVRTFQRTSIYANLSTLENVALSVRSRSGNSYSIRSSAAAERACRDEAAQILEKVGLAREGDRLAAHLCHGSQRALDIAIGVALDPKLILMDEPLAGMARGDREKIAELIKALRADLGLTVVLVEHDVGMVMRLSDCITVMQYGAVIADGPPAEVRDNEDVKKAYLKGAFAA